MRVKIIYSLDFDKLEEKINMWLSSHRYVNVKDIKFHTHSDKQYGYTFYAMIIYEGGE